MKRFLLLLILLVSAAACQERSDQQFFDSEFTATPPSFPELMNATYRGINDTPVSLVDGEWQGEPYIEGGASRPTVGLAGNFSLYGDVDGDGADEAVALIWSSSGGSGTFDYISVMDRDAQGVVVNTGTAPLGDRVKVQSAEVADGRIVIDVIQAGPQDAACCPGQKVRRIFNLYGARLVEMESEDLGRVSPTDQERSE